MKPFQMNPETVTFTLETASLGFVAAVGIIVSQTRIVRHFILIVT